MKISNDQGFLNYGTCSWLFTISGNESAGFNFHTYRSCREEFQGLFTTNTQHVGYIYASSGIGMNKQNFTKFWREIETRLGLKPCVIHEVDGGPNAIVLEVDPWWRQNSTRRSFFTLFLRCGVCYYKGDFDKAFAEYSLARYIPDAIKLFLSGHTTPSFDSGEIGSGCVQKFYNKSKAELESMLLKVELA